MIISLNKGLNVALILTAENGTASHFSQLQVKYMRFYCKKQKRTKYTQKIYHMTKAFDNN